MGAYKIKVESQGRGGWVFYIEQGQLPFSWELLGGRGTGIYIPITDAWDAYCEKHNAEWAKGRRDEIVERVAEGVLKKWYKNGTYEIVEDRWLNIYPGHSLFSKLFG